MALVSSRRASQVIDSPGAEIPPLFWPSVAQWSGDVNGQLHISARIYISRITRQNTRSWTETIFLRSVYPEVACAQLSNGLSVRISSRTPPSESPVHPGTVYMGLQRPTTGNPPKKNKRKILHGDAASVGFPGQIRGLRGIKECQ